MSSDAPQTVKTPSGLTLALSPDETRLALLGVVDFEGDWEAMEAATTLVVDGPAKASLIRDRLAPAATAVDEAGSVAFEVAECLFGRLRPAELWAALSQVVGYLDVLVAEGRLVAGIEDGRRRYRPR